MIIKKSEYDNAVKVIKAYEKQKISKVKKTPKIKVVTHNDRRLNKAKTLYPNGVKFTSLFGREGIVSNDADSYMIGDYGDVFIFSMKSNEWLMVYDNSSKQWTKK